MSQRSKALIITGACMVVIAVLMAIFCGGCMIENKAEEPRAWTICLLYAVAFAGIPVLATLALWSISRRHRFLALFLGFAALLVFLTIIGCGCEVIDAEKLKDLVKVKLESDAMVGFQPLYKAKLWDKIGDDVIGSLVKDNLELRQTAGRDVKDYSGGAWVAVVVMAMLLPFCLILLAGAASWIKTAGSEIASRSSYGRQYKVSVSDAASDMATSMRNATRRVSWFHPICKIGGIVANAIFEKNKLNVLKPKT